MQFVAHAIAICLLGFVFPFSIDERFAWKVLLRKASSVCEIPAAPLYLLTQSSFSKSQEFIPAAVLSCDNIPFGWLTTKMDSFFFGSILFFTIDLLPQHLRNLQTAS